MLNLSKQFQNIYDVLNSHLKENFDNIEIICDNNFVLHIVSNLLYEGNGNEIFFPHLYDIETNAKFSPLVLSKNISYINEPCVLIFINSNLQIKNNNIYTIYYFNFLEQVEKEIIIINIIIMNKFYKNNNNNGGYNNNFDKRNAFDNKCFCILKPYVLEQGTELEILSFIKQNLQLNISYVTKKKFPKNIWEKLYEEHSSKHFYDELCSYLDNKDVYIVGLEGDKATERLRAALGGADPNTSEEGSIRKKWGLSLTDNGIHVSTVDRLSIERKIVFDYSKTQYTNNQGNNHYNKDHSSNNYQFGNNQNKWKNNFDSKRGPNPNSGNYNFR
ncbi:Nucleoside diphosphate kinase [bacterium AB1]|nr:Nucleoside diphosphate kinase [bacterium AB1]